MRPSKRKDLMLLIKPAENSRYEHVVNLLDEMVINDVSHYAIMDISPAEKLAMMAAKR